MIGTLLDFLQREESVFTRASQGHILSAGFGVILIGLVAFSLSLQRTWPGLSIGHIGLMTTADDRGVWPTPVARDIRNASGETAAAPNYRAGHCAGHPFTPSTPARVRAPRGRCRVSIRRAR